MISRIIKRNFSVPTIWSHTRNINVLHEKGEIKYEIPMYFEDEMEAKLVSMYKSNLANTIVIEFCVENVEQNATPTQPQMPRLQ